MCFYICSEVVHPTFTPHIFFCLSKVWSMLHHGLVGQVQNKIKNIYIFSGIFLTVFVFYNKILVFLKKWLHNVCPYWIRTITTKEFFSLSCLLVESSNLAYIKPEVLQSILLKWSRDWNWKLIFWRNNFKTFVEIWFEPSITRRFFFRAVYYPEHRF